MAIDRASARAPPTPPLTPPPEVPMYIIWSIPNKRIQAIIVEAQYQVPVGYGCSGNDIALFFK